MKLLRNAIGLMVLLYYLSNGSALASPAIVENWDKLSDNLSDIIALLDTEQKAPRSSWIPFKDDKESVGLEIRELLDEAIEILKISDLTQFKNRISEAQDNIRRFEKLISELQAKKLMAPENVASWKLWKKDLEDYQEEIDDFQQKIKENQNLIEQLKDKLYHKIRSTGLNLSPEQVDTLVLSITGDDDIEMITVFNNVKAITSKLQQLTGSSGENIETARKYYGMYTVLLRILIALQEDYLLQIDDRYLPAIEDVIKENQALMDKTRKLMGQGTPQHRTMYAANFKAQQLTDQTARLYRRYLDQNKDRVQASVNKTKKEYQVAENTYQTVSTAYTLVTMIRESDRMFDALASLQVPDLLIFENKDMKLEFQKLTHKLKEEQ